MVRLYHRSQTSKKFRKAIRYIKKQGKNEEKLIGVLGCIKNDSLESYHNDHALKGKLKGHRGCHIEGDWVLVYRFEGDTLILVDTGTHAQVYDM